MHTSCNTAIATGEHHHQTMAWPGSLRLTKSHGNSPSRDLSQGSSDSQGPATRDTQCVGVSSEPALIPGSRGRRVAVALGGPVLRERTAGSGRAGPRRAGAGQSPPDWLWTAALGSARLPGAGSGRRACPTQGVSRVAGLAGATAPSPSRLVLWESPFAIKSGQQSIGGGWTGTSQRWTLSRSRPCWDTQAGRASPCSPLSRVSGNSAPLTRKSNAKMRAALADCWSGSPYSGLLNVLLGCLYQC